MVAFFLICGFCIITKVIGNIKFHLGIKIYTCLNYQKPRKLDLCEKLYFLVFFSDLDVTTATVHVQPPTINISKSTVSGTSGKSVTLTCSVTSSETVKDVYWKKDGKAKINSSSNSKKYSGCSASTPSLTILNVEKNDAGSYICFAKNSGGQGESSAIKLDVSEPPSEYD